MTPVKPNPRKGETWKNSRGYDAFVLDAGDRGEPRVSRVMRYRYRDIERTATVTNFLRTFSPTVACSVAPARALPRVGETWGARISRGVIIDAGDPKLPRRERRVAFEVLVGRGGLRVGEIRSARVSDMLATWTRTSEARAA